MKTIDLHPMTDNDIARLWNELAVCFEGIKTNRPNTLVVGFFQLSRETGRRGLQIAKDRAGKIILEPKILKP